MDVEDGGERDSSQGSKGKKISSDRWWKRSDTCRLRARLLAGQRVRATHLRALLTSLLRSLAIASDRSQGGIPHKNGCKALC